MVERERQRENPAPRDQAAGWLQSDNAAGAGGVAHAAAGVAAEGHRKQPAGYSRAGARRRAARVMLVIPWVARGWPRKVKAGTADRKLVGRQLTQDDRPRCAAATRRLHRWPPHSRTGSW